MKRLIFHIDVNSAFLSWESVKRLKENPSAQDLRLIPSAIGGDRKSRRGIILAKSSPAKKYGITTGEPISSALKKCPELVLAAPDFGTYHQFSSHFIKILQRYAPVVEQASIDEAYLDMSGTCKIYPDPIAIAYEIKDAIKNQLGFTVNIGISENKLLAKMASDFEKPDKVHTLFSEEIAHKMWSLPVVELFFVGKSTAGKLNAMGIHSIGELANAPKAMLISYFGEKQGMQLHNYANGIDNSPVLAEEEAAKCYGNSITLPFDLEDSSDADPILLSLCDSVASRMRADDVTTGLLTVSIKDCNFRTHSHQRVLPLQTDVTEYLYRTALQLFDELWDKRTPLRLIGVSVGQLSHGEEEFHQMTLLESVQDSKKQKSLDKMVDQIRRKYGSSSVTRASCLTSATCYHVGEKQKE